MIGKRAAEPELFHSRAGQKSLNETWRSGIHSNLRITIVMPVRDDWVSAGELIRRLNRTISVPSCSFDILIVDDGSMETSAGETWREQLTAIRSVRALRLRRNVGHQRAIGIGLSHLENEQSSDAVLVMDADGEDTPEGALQLIQAFLAAGRSRAVFAERSRRTESVTFRIFYLLYKALHLALTGIPVKVGNFSIMPARYLTALVVVPELWNHYAAAVFRSSLPLEMTPIARGRRIAGKSRMNFISLVMHGLSAMSVFSDVIGVRILLACLAGMTLSAGGIGGVLAMRLFTGRGIPAFALYAIGILGILFLQLLAVGMSFTFFILSSRMNVGCLPARDYSFFVAGVTDLYPND